MLGHANHRLDSVSDRGTLTIQKKACADVISWHREAVVRGGTISRLHGSICSNMRPISSGKTRKKCGTLHRASTCSKPVVNVVASDEKLNPLLSKINGQHQKTFYTIRTSVGPLAPLVP